MTRVSAGSATPSAVVPLIAGIIAAVSIWRPLSSFANPFPSFDALTMPVSGMPQADAFIVAASTQDSGHGWGRFAPSPTGPLHLGSLVAALGSWLCARRDGDGWLVRIEDIDPARAVPGAALGQLRMLAAFGLVSDMPVLWQSTREAEYAQALRRLLDMGAAFECVCSRTDLQATRGIHRHCLLGPAESRRPAVRVRAPLAPVRFHDACRGEVVQALADEIGDYVVRRVDGHWAYQLAVVVDDAAQGITQVVRGADLLDSTPRQIHLQGLLGLPTPRYLHLPVLQDSAGRKLSKSLAALPVDADEPLPALSAAYALLGQDARVLAGIRSADQALHAALAHFRPEAIPATDVTVPAGNRSSA